MFCFRHIVFENKRNQDALDMSKEGKFLQIILSFIPTLDKLVKYIYHIELHIFENINALANDIFFQ